LKEGDDSVWTVVNKAGEKLIITMEEILHDSSHELGVDPGLIKDGVEAHLQEIHADDRAYKPLNWMSPPCTLKEGDDSVWTVVNKAGEKLIITMEEILHDSSHELGVDPGLIKDGVEAHLQELLADRIETLGEGYSLIRREYPTAIGPVDILCRDSDGATVAVEIKRRGEIDGVEQLTRYLDLLNRDPHLAPVKGVFAAQEIKPQARVLATDRGIGCVVLDYDALRGIEDDKLRLF
jgi:RecB family endonuclease NucS